MRACGDDALAAPKTRGDKRLVVLHGLDGDGTGLGSRRSARPSRSPRVCRRV
jgi:hypothetical protein